MSEEKSTKMEKTEMIWLASVAIGKGIDYESFGYSDYMYGNRDVLEDVWEYVTEAENIGIIAFKEKYKDYKLYI